MTRRARGGPPGRGPGRRARRLAALALGAAVAACGPSDPEEAGRAKFDAGEFRDAIPYLKAAAGDPAAPPEVLERLASALAEVRDFGGSVRVFEDLAKRPGAAGRALVLEVTMLLKAKRGSDAARAVAGAERRIPGSAAVAEASGLCHASEGRRLLAEVGRSLDDQLGRGRSPTPAASAERVASLAETRYAESRDAFFGALETAHEFPARERLGGVLDAAHHELVLAAADFSRALEIEPDRPRSLYESAVLARARGADADAVSALERLVRAPAPPRLTTLAEKEADLLRRDALRLLAEAAESLGDREKAKRAFSTLRDVLVRHGEDPIDGDMTLARLEHEDGRLGAMETVLDGHLARKTLDDARPSYWKGILLFERRDLAPALVRLQEAVARAPSNAEAALALARCEVALGRLDRAAAHYDRVVELVPGRAEALAERAAVLDSLGNADAATGALIEALATTFRSRSDPGRRVVQEALLAIYRRHGVGLASLPEAEQAYAKDPENVLVALALARFLLRDGRTADAAAAMKTPLERYPEMPEVQAVGGMIDLAAKRLDEAERRFARAAAERPDDPEILWYQGRTAFEKNDSAGARRHLERALGLRSDFPQARRLLVLVDRAEGKPDATIEDGRKVLAAYPDELDVFCAVARAYAGTHREGEAAWMRAPSVPAGDAEGRKRIGLAFLDVARGAEAEEILVGLARSSPDDGGLALDLAGRLAAAGRFAGALACLEPALRDPHSPKRGALLALAARCNSARKADAALLRTLVDLRQAADHAEEPAIALETCLGLGRADEALSNATQVLREGSKDPKTLALAARAFVLGRKPDEAQKVLGTLEALGGPLPPDALATKGRALLLAHRKQEGLEALDGLLAKAPPPERAAIFRDMLLGLQDSGDLEGAAARAALASADAASDAGVRLLAARILVQKGEHQKALPLLLALASREDAPEEAVLGALVLGGWQGPKSALGLAPAKRAARAADPRIPVAAAALRLMTGDAEGSRALLAERPDAAASRPGLFLAFLAAVADKRQDDVDRLVRDPRLFPRVFAKDVSAGAAEWAALGADASSPCATLARSAVLDLWEPSRGLAGEVLAGLRSQVGASSRALAWFAADQAIERGDAPAAVRIVRPFLAKSTDDEPALLLQGKAGIAGSGRSDPGPFLRAAFRRRTLTQDFALDVVEVLLRFRRPADALPLFAHVTVGTDDVDGLLARTYAEAGRPGEAWRVIAKHPAALDLRWAQAVKLEAYVEDPESRAEAAASGRRWLATGGDDPAILGLTLRALALTGKMEDARSLALAYLDASPFDAQRVLAVARALADAPAGAAFLDEVRGRAAVLDPAGILGR